MKRYKPLLNESLKTYKFQIIAYSEHEYEKLFKNYINALKEHNIKYKLEYNNFYRVGDQYRNTIFVQIDSKIMNLNNLYMIINKIKPIKIDTVK